MKPGDEFVYSESGMVANVTLVSYEFQKNWHSFEFKVDDVVAKGPLRDEFLPKSGDVMKVGYADGFRHYAGWSFRRRVA